MSFPRWLIAVALVLLAPLIAMQFTDEVRWSPRDFLTMGSVLIGAGAFYEFANRHSQNSDYRAGVVVSLIAAVSLVWITGAVGLVASENENANLIFLLVPIVAIASAVIAKFRAQGMFIAMIAAASAQIVTAVMAFALASEDLGSRETWKILILNAIFAAFWLASSLLFRKAARAA